VERKIVERKMRGMLASEPALAQGLVVRQSTGNRPLTLSKVLIYF
jgi:hypothetical protein